MTRFRMLMVLIVLGWVPPAAAQAGHPDYEFSFSTSQMFIDDVSRVDLKSVHKIALPTTSALFIGEYFWNDRFSTVAAFNLPLMAKRYVVNGAIVEEVASSVFLLGQGWRFVEWPFGQNSRLAVQAAALISVIDNPVTASPSAALRLHLASNDNFTMFLGSVVTYGINGFVLFYGVGHRF